MFTHLFTSCQKCPEVATCVFGPLFFFFFFCQIFNIFLMIKKKRLKMSWSHISYATNLTSHYSYLWLCGFLRQTFFLAWPDVAQQNSYSISHLLGTVTTQWLPLWRCSYCSLVPDTVTTEQWLHRTHTLLGIHYHGAYVEICLLGI